MNKNSKLRGMRAMLMAQFFSVLADNALLFVAIGLLKAHAAPSWQIPMLQQFFIFAFILLGPFVGPFSDYLPKGRVLMISNAIKLIGAGAMAVGLNPLLAYAIVGFGATTYATAKFGMLAEMVPADNLVKANSFLESSSLAAILFGTVAGGLLADKSLTVALSVLLALYCISAVFNAFIPNIPPRYRTPLHPVVMIRDVFVAMKKFASDPHILLSVSATSLFWSSGAAIRLMLVLWVPVAMGRTDLSTPANLSAALGLGVILGSILAARYRTVDNAHKSLPAGLIAGGALIAVAFVSSMPLAFLLLVVFGASGGFYLMPFNAVLQSRGKELVGPGRAVAVQNMLEYIMMMVVLFACTTADKASVSPVHNVAGLGAFLFLTFTLLHVRQRAASRIRL